MCKKNYLSPRVKTVAFEVEDGYQASQLETLDAGFARLQKYNKEYDNCDDFFGTSYGDCGLSTSGYQQEEGSFF